MCPTSYLSAVLDFFVFKALPMHSFRWALTNFDQMLIEECEWETGKMGRSDDKCENRSQAKANVLADKKSISRKRGDSTITGLTLYKEHSVWWKKCFSFAESFNTKKRWWCSYRTSLESINWKYIKFCSMSREGDERGCRIIIEFAILIRECVFEERFVWGARVVQHVTH